MVRARRTRLPRKGESPCESLRAAVTDSRPIPLPSPLPGPLPTGSGPAVDSPATDIL